MHKNVGLAKNYILNRYGVQKKKLLDPKKKLVSSETVQGSFCI
jgi:hypothetical protein